jgi:peptide/nickel transport system substrate-binding protein
MDATTQARGHRLRAGGALAAVATIALVAGACGGGNATAAPPSGGGNATPAPASDGGAGATAAPATAAPSSASTADIPSSTWAIQSAPRSMDVAHGTDVPTRRIISAAFDRLLTMGNDGSLQPWIAESWTNPDPLTYEFKLRPGVTFWDGSPLTAEDVVYSLQRHLDPETASELAWSFPTVASVEATDDSTVTVKLNAPDASFPYRAALDWYIVQKAYSEAAGADLGTPAKPGMGTGPYTIEEFSTAEGATLKRFDGYWGDKPKVKTLEFKVITDPETLRLAMLAGEVHGAFDVPLLAARKFDALDTVAMQYVDAPYLEYLSMRVTTPPFDDPKVREAMAHLVDRDGLIGPLFNGRATLSTTIVPRLQFAATLGEDGAQAYYEALPGVPAFDIEAARAALAASGSPDGFSVELPFDPSQPWMQPFAENLAENAKQIGITVTPVSISNADWVTALSDPGAGPLQLVSMATGTPNPGELPPTTLGASEWNTSRWTSPEIEARLGEVVAAPTAKDAAELLVPILTAVGEELPYVPLFDEQAALAMSKSLVWQDGYSPWVLGQVWPLFIRSAS